MVKVAEPPGSPSVPLVCTVLSTPALENPHVVSLSTRSATVPSASTESCAAPVPSVCAMLHSNGLLTLTGAHFHEESNVAGLNIGSRPSSAGSVGNMNV